MTDLMIILGSPASGKTTLARRLAAEFSVPCLCKDDIKEALFDVLGVADRAASKRLSDASFAAELRVARTQLEAGLLARSPSANVRPKSGCPMPMTRCFTGLVMPSFQPERGTPATWTRHCRAMSCNDGAWCPPRSWS